MKFLEVLIKKSLNHLGRRGDYWTKEKWLPFKNTGHIDIIFHVHMLGVIYVHICLRYEITMIKQVARQRGHR